MVKVIQPASWAGMQKGGPDSPMVCGACPDWERCAANSWCDRATLADYLPGFLPHSKHPCHPDNGGIAGDVTCCGECKDST